MMVEQRGLMMFDSQTQNGALRLLKAVPIAHLAREGRWSLDSPRSYLVPVLLWFTDGQGRLGVGDALCGYTAHNAIYLPANTLHACEICGRTQGTALFLGSDHDLPAPDGPMHLRLTALQDHSEINLLVEGFRRDSAEGGPLIDEILHHRAALITLWLLRQSLSQRTPNLIAAPDMDGRAEAAAPHDAPESDI